MNVAGSVNLVSIKISFYRSVQEQYLRGRKFYNCILWSEIKKISFMIDMFSKEKESLLDGDVSSTIEKVSAKWY